MNHTQRHTQDTNKPSNGEQGPGPDVRRGPGPELMSAATLVGNAVRNPGGDELGDIKEIMLDMRTGRIGYAVMSFGGFLGMGGKLFAVPWDALTLDTTDKCFVLDVARARLHSAPGFNKDKWPNMADAAWAREIHAYYGTQASFQPGGHPPAMPTANPGGNEAWS